MTSKKTEEQEWELHTEKKIQAAFRLYDKDNKGTVSEDEVQYIMRYLNVYPTEVAMVNLIKAEMQDDEPTTYVTYERLKTVLLRLMKTKEWEPDAEDILIQAFKTLDTEVSEADQKLMRPVLKKNRKSILTTPSLSFSHFIPRSYRTRDILSGTRLRTF